MDLGTMVRELGTGMLITTEIFVLTLVFSLPLGMVPVSYTHLTLPTT